MVDVTPAPQTDHDRIVVLECAVSDLQDDIKELGQYHKDRVSREHWIIGIVVGVATTLVYVLIAVVHA